VLGAAPAARHPGFGAVHLARRAFYHLLSFEALFTLYFYSNQVKLLLPPLPVDETVVLAALSMPIGLAIILREGIYLRGLTIVAAGLLLFTWAALSWGWSPSRSLASRTLAFLFTFNLWCLVSGALIIAPSRERAARFLALSLILAALLAGYGLYVYATYGTFRFYGGFGAIKRIYLSWGYAATNGAIIAFALLIFSRAFSLRQLVAAALFILCSAFLLVGSGRGPFLAVVAACLVALAAGLPRVGRRRIEIPKWQLMALVALIAGAGYVIYLAGTGTTFHTFNRFAKLFEEMHNPDVVLGANRFDYYAAAIQFWLRAPIVGNGIASYSLLFSGTEIFGTQPHNIVLEMLSDLGLVGLALLLLLLWSGLRQVSLARLRDDGLLLCVLLLVTGRLLAAMISIEISGQQALFLFLGMLALRPAPGPRGAARRAAPAGGERRAAGLS
jgi:O-antigen ligase